MKRLANERGSTLVETMISMTSASLLIGGGLIAVYISFARVWLNREIYEAVICLSTSAQQNECENHLRHATQTALPAGKVADLRLTRTRSEARVKLSFRVAGKKVFEMEDSRRLPLITSPLDKL